tara:strand:- start:2371 stop:2586 length:216 start_codon:yes stop_codon:yes gene_type:complete
MSRNEFKYGRIGVVIGIILIIIPYLHKIGAISIVFGGILILVSSASNRAKLTWIIPSVIVLGALYYMTTNN